MRHVIIALVVEVNCSRFHTHHRWAPTLFHAESGKRGLELGAAAQVHCLCGTSRRAQVGQRVSSARAGGLLRVFQGGGRDGHCAAEQSSVRDAITTSPLRIVLIVVAVVDAMGVVACGTVLARNALVRHCWATDSVTLDPFHHL